MRSASDAELINESLYRSEAFHSIFDRHAPKIMRYLRLRLGDHLAEELTAETFTQAFRSRGRFSTHHASALPWLYGIAGNLVRMHWRSEQRRLDAYAQAASMGQLASAGPELDLELNELTPVLSQGLSVLPAGQREVLLLHAWAELSHEEIGEVMGISAGQARKRLHQARHYLASQLERSDQSARASCAPDGRNG